MFHNQINKLDRKLRERIAEVAAIATKHGEAGIAEWAVRAANDAVALGRIRDKDIKTLERLEDTFGHEFYRNNDNGAFIHA